MTAERSPLGLGPLEQAIMRALWDASDSDADWLTITGIREVLDYRPVAYTTVATVLSILCRKGLARRLPGLGRQWVYRAAQPLSDYIGGLIAALLAESPSPAQSLACAQRSRACPPAISWLDPERVE